MKLGIHSAPERVSTGSTSGASSSTRPRAGSSTISATNRSTASRAVVDDVSVDIARRADIVVDRANELVAVGEALVEVALGQPGRAADRAHGQPRAAFAAQQRHAGGDQFVAAQHLAVLQGNAGPAAPSLTGRHITPKLLW